MARVTASQKLIGGVKDRLAKLGILPVHVESYFGENAGRKFVQAYKEYMLNPANCTRINGQGNKESVSLPNRAKYFADSIADEIAETLGIELNPIVRGRTGMRDSTVASVLESAESFDLDW